MSGHGIDSFSELKISHQAQQQNRFDFNKTGQEKDVIVYLQYPSLVARCPCLLGGTRGEVPGKQNRWSTNRGWAESLWLWDHGSFRLEIPLKSSSPACPRPPLTHLPSCHVGAVLIRGIFDFCVYLNGRRGSAGMHFYQRQRRKIRFVHENFWGATYWNGWSNQAWFGTALVTQSPPQWLKNTKYFYCNHKDAI